MKMNPRAIPVAKAVNEAEGWLLDWSMRHGLTAAEVVKFHAQALLSLSNGSIREERREDERAARSQGDDG